MFFCVGESIINGTYTQIWSLTRLLKTVNTIKIIKESGGVPDLGKELYIFLVTPGPSSLVFLEEHILSCHLAPRPLNRGHYFVPVLHPGQQVTRGQRLVPNLDGNLALLTVLS